MLFDVTYETITPESAENGDAETRGYLLENASLRDAIDAMGYPGEGCESNEYPVRSPRWITAYRVNEDYATGETENRSLHFPDNMSAASKRRLCKLLDVYGV